MGIFHFVHSLPKQIFLEHHSVHFVLSSPLPVPTYFAIRAVNRLHSYRHKQLCKTSRLNDSVSASIDSHKVDTDFSAPSFGSTLWNFSVASGMIFSLCVRVWHVFYQHTLFSLAFLILCAYMPDRKHDRQREIGIENNKEKWREEQKVLLLQLFLLNLTRVYIAFWSAWTHFAHCFWRTCFIVERSVYTYPNKKVFWVFFCQCIVCLCSHLHIFSSRATSSSMSLMKPQVPYK